MTVDIAEFLEIALGIFLTMNGGWFFAIKWLLNNHMKTIKGDFSTLIDQQGESSKRITKLEKDLLSFQTYVARNYIAREDWIRTSTSMTAKIDGLSESITGLRLEIGQHGPQSRSVAS